MSVQGSSEWFAERLGKVTASRVADVIAMTKSGYSASRANYAAQLVAERLSGSVEASFSNAAMQWGTEHEAEARAAYEFVTDNAVAVTGFEPHPEIAMSGASPDGLVGELGLVEIKCPNTATHIDTLVKGTIPKKYITQMQWQMACTCRKWCDFVSYDPRLPERMRLFTQRVEINNAMVTDLETEVRAFLDEIDATVQKLTARYGEQA